MHERCECHECTQARWKSSVQYSLDSFIAQGGDVCDQEPHNPQTCPICQSNSQQRPQVATSCQ